MSHESRDGVLACVTRELYETSQNSLHGQFRHVKALFVAEMKVSNLAWFLLVLSSFNRNCDILFTIVYHFLYSLTFSRTARELEVCCTFHVQDVGPLAVRSAGKLLLEKSVLN